MVVKAKSLRGTLMTGLQKGLQGIIYDNENDNLLACDAGSGKIIKIDPTTGILMIK